MSNDPSLHAGAESAVLYSEKLWPKFGNWIVVLGVSAAGILILAPITMLAGYLCAVGLLIGQTLFLILTTPRIAVTAETLQVGRAHIERKYIGLVEPFRDDEAFAERGTRLNGLAYMCIRGWVKHVVKIEIADPSDPTPYWLTSSRTPEKLANALATSTIAA